VTACHLIWFRALELSVDYNHPVYDTLFIALAEQKKTKLITYDKEIIKKFPHHVCPIQDYLKID
jgi:predicted nucleic acid-binding protein